jgi:hypothetical protein
MSACPAAHTWVHSTPGYTIWTGLPLQRFAARRFGPGPRRRARWGGRGSGVNGTPKACPVGAPSGAPTVAALPLPRPSTVPARPIQNVLRGPGQPLAAPLREEMQARLGADFSDAPPHQIGGSDA